MSSVHSIEAEIYNSEIKDISQKQDIIDRWFRDGSKPLICMKGFGLGIDFPRVRYVFLCGLPFSIEDFSQLAGRAGRDGKPMTVVLFLNRQQERNFLEAMESFPAIYSTLAKVNMLFNTPNVCIRRLHCSYMTGKEVECSYDPEAELCSHIREVKSFSDLTLKMLPRPEAVQPYGIELWDGEKLHYTRWIHDSDWLAGTI